MSLKDVVEAVEASAKGFLPAKPTEPGALREPVLQAIRRAEEQWAHPQPDRPAEWFSQDQDRVAFTPKLANGAPLTIDGLTTTFISAERFPDFLAAMRAAVEAGTFDSEIEAGLTGSPNVSGLASVTMPQS